MCFWHGRYLDLSSPNRELLKLAIFYLEIRHLLERDPSVLDHRETYRLGALEDPRCFDVLDQVGTDRRLLAPARVGENRADAPRQVRQRLTLDGQPALGQGDVQIDRVSLRRGLELDDA